MTSSTGGTGALTCAAQTGYPLVSKAFTGTRFVEYSIVEYTSSAKTQPSKAETGIGSYVTSTEVLTRTKVLSTWDATDYLPKFGTATAPTALSFGTTSANIDIMVGPMAGFGAITPSFNYGSVASVSSGEGVHPLNMVTVAANPNNALQSGYVYYHPVLLAYPQMISQVSVRQVTGTSGGTPKFDAALCEIASDGTPGKRLISFTQMSIGTANTTYQSTAVATPVFFAPGWYWFAHLYLANSATGTPTFRSAALWTGGPQGSLFSASNAPVSSIFSNSGQTTIADPPATPTGQLDGVSVILPKFE